MIVTHDTCTHPDEPTGEYKSRNRYSCHFGMLGRVNRVQVPVRTPDIAPGQGVLEEACLSRFSHKERKPGLKTNIRRILLVAAFAVLSMTLAVAVYSPTSFANGFFCWVDSWHMNSKDESNVNISYVTEYEGTTAYRLDCTLKVLCHYIRPDGSWHDITVPVWSDSHTLPFWPNDHTYGLNNYPSFLYNNRPAPVSQWESASLDFVVGLKVVNISTGAIVAGNDTRLQGSWIVSTMF